jgi:large conductance mechanosensitive channel
LAGGRFLRMTESDMREDRVVKQDNEPLTREEAMDNFVDKSKEELSGAVRKMGGAVSEFRAFLKNYNVVGMAIGIVMGVATTALVNSVVNSLVMPLINLIMPRDAAWQQAGIVLRSAGEPAEQFPAVKLLYGDVISAALNFVIIALVVFMFAKYILREEKVTKK